MMGTMQNLSLLCCFALFFLLPHHVMADAGAGSSGPLRAPELVTAPMGQPSTGAGLQRNPPAELNDIHDIYGPVPLPEPPPYRLYGVGTLLIAAAGALLLVLARFRRKPEIITAVAPSDQALADLQKAEKKHRETGDLGHYCDDVTTILRTYVEQVSGYRISSRTTMESLNELAERDTRTSFAGSRRLDLLKRCFTCCDMVKFAGFSPDETERERIGQLAASFVSETGEQGDA